MLTNLATAQHIGTVVLDSNEMPPTNPAVFEDDAVTSVRTADGLTMTALLADHVLTGVLAAGDTSTGALPPGTQFAVSQRFLAETAMIAAEAPDSDRSIVVAPPEDWSPSAALASQLLKRDHQHAVAGAHRAGQPGPGGGQRAWHQPPAAAGQQGQPR